MLETTMKFMPLVLLLAVPYTFAQSDLIEEYPCPMPMCEILASQCPEGSHWGVKNYTKICAGSDDKCCGTADCGGCVSDEDDTQYMAIPKCFQGRVLCAEPLCPAGSVAQIKTPAGKNGAEPCCPEFECVAEVAALIAGASVPKDELGAFEPLEPISVTSDPVSDPDFEVTDFEPCLRPVCAALPLIGQCPQGSSPGFKNFSKICAGSDDECCGSSDCGGCLSDVDDTVYVDVLVEEKTEDEIDAANKEGPVLQDPEVTELDIPCPRPLCSAPPSQCPKGSHPGFKNFDKICSQPENVGDKCCGMTDCGGCVNDLDDTQYVDVPACIEGAVFCAQPACSQGLFLQVKTPRGENGAEPCCDEFECVASLDEDPVELSDSSAASTATTLRSDSTSDTKTPNNTATTGDNVKTSTSVKTTSKLNSDGSTTTITTTTVTTTDSSGTKVTKTNKTTKTTRSTSSSGSTTGDIGDVHEHISNKLKELKKRLDDMKKRHTELEADIDDHHDRNGYGDKADGVPTNHS